MPNMTAGYGRLKDMLKDTRQNEVLKNKDENINQRKHLFHIISTTPDQLLFYQKKLIPKIIIKKFVLEHVRLIKKLFNIRLVHIRTRFKIQVYVETFNGLNKCLL